MRLRLSLICAAFSRNPIAAAELIRFWFAPSWPYAPTFATPVVLPVPVERGHET